MNCLEAHKRRLRSTFRCNVVSAGFTLPELMLTMLIAIIFTVIVMVSYQRELRRSQLQTDAIALATRIEQAESLAKLGARVPSVSQFRIRIDSTNNTYIPEMFNTSSKVWVAAPAISSTSIRLARGIKFGYGVIPNSAPGQAATAPLQATEIRFGTQGFPVSKPTSTTSISPPVPYDNAIYLTDGRNYFAITVNILGRVQVWNYSNNQWFTITG